MLKFLYCIFFTADGIMNVGAEFERTAEPSPRPLIINFK